MTPALIQMLGFGRDLLLIAGGALFGAFAANWAAKRRGAKSHWEDMLEGIRARAFAVAGATDAGMLADFRAAIDKAITGGRTLEDLRLAFDAALELGENLEGSVMAKHAAKIDYAITSLNRSRLIFEAGISAQSVAGMRRNRNCLRGQAIRRLLRAALRIGRGL